MPVMRIVGLVSGEPTPFDGQYLVEYDPERDGTDAEGSPMTAYLVTSPNRAEAREFADGRDAVECWRQASRRMPRRPDGKPNRPLTAFTVEIK